MEKFHCLVRLVDRREIAENTAAIFLSKPDGFSFVPGAHIGLILPRLSETEGGGNRRDFSLASAPFEKELMVAMRLRDSAFKRSLARLPLNEELLMEGPFGSFRLRVGTGRPAVFIAGGVGIAPFMSILRQEHHDGFSPTITITLFYSNRRLEDAAFLKELRVLSDTHPRFVFVPTMTNLQDATAPWAGEIGRISNDLLSKYIFNFQTPRYYIAGSPAMVAAMEKLLTGAGVPPEDIHTEEFVGY